MRKTNPRKPPHHHRLSSFLQGDRSVGWNCNAMGKCWISTPKLVRTTEPNTDEWSGPSGSNVTGGKIATLEGVGCVWCVGVWMCWGLGLGAGIEVEVCLGFLSHPAAFSRGERVRGVGSPRQNILPHAWTDPFCRAVGGGPPARELTPRLPCEPSGVLGLLEGVRKGR